MKILNLTQHMASAEQLAAGVMDLLPADRELLMKELTFTEVPDHIEVSLRARSVAYLAWCYANDGGVAMIGGAPFLMAPLERELKRLGFKPVYAFSKRESAEEEQPDGSLKKTQVFRHAGFVSVCEL